MLWLCREFGHCPTVVYSVQRVCLVVRGAEQKGRDGSVQQVFSAPCVPPSLVSESRIVVVAAPLL